MPAAALVRTGPDWERCMGRCWDEAASDTINMSADSMSPMSWMTPSGSGASTGPMITAVSGTSKRVPEMSVCSRGGVCMA